MEQRLERLEVAAGQPVQPEEPQHEAVLEEVVVRLAEAVVGRQLVVAVEERKVHSSVDNGQAQNLEEEEDFFYKLMLWRVF